MEQTTNQIINIFRNSFKAYILDKNAIKYLEKGVNTGITFITLNILIFLSFLLETYTQPIFKNIPNGLNNPFIYSIGFTIFLDILILIWSGFIYLIFTLFKGEIELKTLFNVWITLSIPMIILRFLITIIPTNFIQSRSTFSFIIGGIIFIIMIWNIVIYTKILSKLSKLSTLETFLIIYIIPTLILLLIIGILGGIISIL